jgi:hypothetical protein
MLAQSAKTAFSPPCCSLRGQTAEKSRGTFLFGGDSFGARMIGRHRLLASAPGSSDVEMVEGKSQLERARGDREQNRT